MQLAKLLEKYSEGFYFYKMLGLRVIILGLVSKILGLTDETQDYYFQFCSMSSNFDMSVKE